MTQIKKEGYVTIREAVDLLESEFGIIITKATLTQYCLAGKFKSAIKMFGTRWVVERKEILQFANNEVDVSGAYSKSV